MIADILKELLEEKKKALYLQTLCNISDMLILSPRSASGRGNSRTTISRTYNPMNRTSTPAGQLKT